MRIRTPRGSSSSGTATTTPPTPTTDSSSTDPNQPPIHQKSLPQWRQNLLAVPEPLRCKTQRDLARAAELSDFLIQTFSPTSEEPRPHRAGNSPQGIRCVLAALECEALSFRGHSILDLAGYPTQFEIYKSTALLAQHYVDGPQIQRESDLSNELLNEQTFLCAAFELWNALAVFWLEVMPPSDGLKKVSLALKHALAMMERIKDFDESALMEEHGSQLTRTQVVAMIQVLGLQYAFAAGQMDAAAWFDYCETLRHGDICWYSMGRLSHVLDYANRGLNAPWATFLDGYELAEAAGLRYIKAAQTTLTPPDPFIIAYLTLDFAACTILSAQSATVGFVEGLLEKAKAATEQCRPWMVPLLRRAAMPLPQTEQIERCLARTREAAALGGKDWRSAMVLSPTAAECKRGCEPAQETRKGSDVRCMRGARP